MKLQNKNILLISPEPWEHLFVSKHHYATHLAERGNKVYFLGPPEKEYSLEETNFPNLWRIGYKGFSKGLRFFPSAIQRWLIKNEFERLQQMAQVSFEVVWSFDNSVFYDFRALPKGVYSISHIVDWNQDFQFRRASETASLCLASSHYILAKQKQYSNNAYFIHHGYVENKKQLHAGLILPGNSSIKVLYAGNLAIEYIDWDLLYELVEGCSTVDFCFAGSGENSSGFAKLRKYPNVFHLGVLAKPHLQISLKTADVLLLTYRWKDFPEQLANPHKMMEYLASGKMIVATWTEEYAQLHDGGLIFMNKDCESFFKDFEGVIDSLNVYNDEKLQEERISFARMNTYSCQLSKIEGFFL